MSESGDPSQESEDSPPGRIRQSVFAIVVVMSAMIMFANWPLQYVAVSESGSVGAMIDFDLETGGDLPVMAGWPYTYWVRYPDRVGDAGSGVFSIASLLLNLALLCVPAAILVVYVFRRDRATHSKGRFSLSIADLLVFTLVLAAPFGWLRYQKSHAEKVGKEVWALRSGGHGVRTSSWVPRILQPYLPHTLVGRLIHIRDVQIENPTEEMVGKVVAIPTLTSLRLGGGSYDLRLLDALAHRIHLTDLRIAGRPVDARVIQMVAANPQLDTLNLMRTNVSAIALHDLSESANLRRLNLMHTDVQLADLGKPAWAENIEVMLLPHPDAGDDASLVIEGWPRLKELTINELDTQRNSQAMTVRLADLPKLETLQLDLFQKFDLELQSLPELTTIKGLFDNWQLRVPRGGAMPGAIWCRKLIVGDLPKLETLNFYAVNIEEFLLRGSPKIAQLGIGAFQYTNEQYDTYAGALDAKAAKALVRGIGKSEGPGAINLDSVPLKGVDLSPLTQNKQITALYLANSESSIKEWKKLEPMKWLKELRLTGNTIGKRDVAWALKTFPELNVLECAANPNDFDAVRFDQEKLELVGHPNLETLSIGSGAWQYGYFESVRVVDMPSLKMPVWVNQTESLEIKNAANLQGFVLSSPLPQQWAIDELSGVKFFAVGGKRITDDVAKSILNAHDLETLTLAHTSVTPEMLAKLPLEKVTGLHLPGSEVTDDVVAQWPELSRLVKLDLRDTKVTGKSFSHLLQSRDLQILRLDHCTASASDLARIKSMPELAELAVAGIQMNADALAPLLQFGKLQALDLSDTTLDAKLLDSIAKSRTDLLLLVMRNCEVDQDAFLRLVRAKPSLVFDLTGSDVATAVYSKLLSDERVAERGELMERLQMENMIAQQQKNRNQRMPMHLGPQYHALIDPDAFAEDGIYGQRALRARQGIPVPPGAARAFLQAIGGGPPTSAATKDAAIKDADAADANATSDGETQRDLEPNDE